jgi:hypothetical protein
VAGVNPVKFVKITSASATPANRGYLNLNAFCSVTSTSNPCTNPVTPGTFGNLGHNAVDGPMGFQFDGQVSRIFPIRERVNLAFRLEAFNIFNHPNFSNPGSSNPSSAAFGEITAQSNAARVFQGSVKVIF